MHDDTYHWGYAFSIFKKDDRVIGISIFQLPSAPFVFTFDLWYFGFELSYECVAPLL